MHRTVSDRRPPFPSFARIPATTRRDHVAAALRRSILSGQIAPGTQLVESGLAAQFGVSRGLLREAVRELIETGLVVNRPYAGAFVTEINGQILRDVYAVRRVLERQAYTSVWPRRDPVFRSELEARFHQMIAAVGTGELANEIRAEAHFHALVYESCGNHLMPAMWQQMTQKIQLGFAICQVACAPKMDFEANHTRFFEMALGDDLAAMLLELDEHLSRGLATIEFMSSRREQGKETGAFR